MQYRSAIYSEYDRVHLSHLRVHSKHTLDLYARSFDSWYGKLLPKDKTARILDVACGVGEFVNFLQNLGYMNAMGIDLGEEQISIGKELNIQNLFLGDAYAYLRENVDSIDFLSVQNFIEHLTKNELFEFLKLSYSSLRPSGILLISTANAQTFFGARCRYSDLTHEISFTPQSILQVLTTAGFDEIQIFPHKPVVHDIKSFARLILWNLLESFMRLFLFAGQGSGRNVGKNFHIFTEAMYAVARKPIR